VQGQYTFLRNCCPFNSPLIRKEDLSTGDYFAVSGNLSATPNETLGNHRSDLSKAGWSWGCVSCIDSEGRTIWIADAHRDDGRRFIVRADEKLTAFIRIGDSRFANLLDRQARSFANSASLNGS
jgi:hypothetical protein